MAYMGLFFQTTNQPTHLRFSSASFRSGSSATAPFIVLATGPQPDALENLEVPKNALCVAEVPQAGDSEICVGVGEWRGISCTFF